MAAHNGQSRRLDRCLRRPWRRRSGAPVGRARRTELQHLPVCLVDVTLGPIEYSECGTIVFENISPGGLNDLWKAKINIYEPFVVNLARQGAPYRE